MNIIRTKAFELSAIPAICYKQKLSSGGSGLRLLRLDQNASASASIDKRTGEWSAYDKFDAQLFPPEAFDEALELTLGQPYAARGKIAVSVSDAAEPEEVIPEKAPDMFGSPEYTALVDRYADERGKLNYALMNKDMIQFAAKSKIVANLVAAKTSADDILLYVVKNRASLVSGQKDTLDDAHTQALIDTLDEIDPRSAFKELKLHIQRMLGKK